MSGEPTIIYSAASVQQAYLLKGLLEDRGIAAWVVNDAMQIAGGELPLGWTAAAKVVVGLDDAEEGRHLAEEFDRRSASGDFTAAPPTDTQPQQWADWPLCPVCRELRSARCPTCEISAHDFPFADLRSTPDGDRVLLFCPDCDDHFLPQWYRLCARCGHDFGSGLVVSADRAPRQWDVRSVSVVAAMLAAVALFAAYFTWLFATQRP